MKMLVAGLVIVFSCGNALADKIAISGDGTVSCATWVGRHQGYHDPNGATLSDWLFGYVTAVNQFASIPGNPPQPNDDALEVWVTNYCAQHPLDMLATAAGRLILELRARAPAPVPTH